MLYSSVSLKKILGSYSKAHEECYGWESAYSIHHDQIYMYMKWNSFRLDNHFYSLCDKHTKKILIVIPYMYGWKLSYFLWSIFKFIYIYRWKNSSMTPDLIPCIHLLLVAKYSNKAVTQSVVYTIREYFSIIAKFTLAKSAVIQIV